MIANGALRAVPTRTHKRSGDQIANPPAADLGTDGLDDSSKLRARHMGKPTNLGSWPIHPCQSLRHRPLACTRTTALRASGRGIGHLGHLRQDSKRLIDHRTHRRSLAAAHYARRTCTPTTRATTRIPDCLTNKGDCSILAGPVVASDGACGPRHSISAGDLGPLANHAVAKGNRRQPLAATAGQGAALLIAEAVARRAGKPPSGEASGPLQVAKAAAPGIGFAGRPPRDVIALPTLGSV